MPNLIPITDAATVADLHAQHERAILNAQAGGVCAAPSIMCGVVCRLAPGHDGVHVGGRMEWGESNYGAFNVPYGDSHTAHATQ